MEMPSIHTCLQLTDVNEKLIIRLKKMKKRNDSLEKELSSINEKLKIEKLLHEHSSVRHVAVQTDGGSRGFRRIIKKPSPQKNLEDDNQKTVESLLKNHRSLMKKYEKEMKVNAKHIETIASLNIRIQELEKHLSSANERIYALEIEGQHSTPGRWNMSRNHERRHGYRTSKEKTSRHSSPKYHPQNYSPVLLSELEAFQLERDKLAKEKKKLKKELGLLDENFFEEIEDLKYALLQSARLNQEYDRALRQICHDHGAPYPLDSLPTKQRIATEGQSRKSSSYTSKK